MQTIAQETGWQSGVRSCMPSQLVQELNIGTVAGDDIPELPAYLVREINTGTVSVTPFHQTSCHGPVPLIRV